MTAPIPHSLARGGVFATRYRLTSAFARWTNAHGSYAVEVQLRNLEGDVLCSCALEAPFEAHDPLLIWIIPLHRLPMQFAPAEQGQTGIHATGR
jgi:hypothetical protein